MSMKRRGRNPACCCGCGRWSRTSDCWKTPCRTAISADRWLRGLPRLGESPALLAACANCWPNRAMAGSPASGRRWKRSDGRHLRRAHRPRKGCRSRHCAAAICEAHQMDDHPALPNSFTGRSSCVRSPSPTCPTTRPNSLRWVISRTITDAPKPDPAPLLFWLASSKFSISVPSSVARTGLQLPALPAIRGVYQPTVTINYLILENSTGS
jgi:hypothetical protein